MTQESSAPRASRSRAGGRNGTRRVATALGVFASLYVGFVLVAAACSSGLGTDRDDGGDGPGGLRGGSIEGVSPNVSFGFDPGFALAIDELDAAGGIVQVAGGTERSVVLFAFTTNEPATTADADGRALSREGLADANGAPDVFLAAVVDTGIDEDSFVQGLLQTFRHPRCETCHGMSVPDTDSFRSVPPTGGLRHPGGNPPLLPGRAADSDADSATCEGCHPAELEWRPPLASKDFRSKSARELFDFIRTPENLPEGESLAVHLTDDPRIGWALGSNGGVLPDNPGGNGIADDDHDGVLEPEDSDGMARTVPGGIKVFRQQTERFLELLERGAAGDPDRAFSSRARAIHDIALVSRDGTGARSGAGASTSPSVRYVPEPAFDPGAAQSVAGHVYVAYASAATDLVAGGTSGTNVFRTQLDLVKQPGGTLDLVFVETLQVNLATTLLGGGGAPCENPSIGGANGEIVAFESAATNLVAGFEDGNGGAPDVFVRDLDRMVTTLVSRSLTGSPTGAERGGDGASGNARVSADGRAVAFESVATDLVADDTNGARDVFFVRLDQGQRTVVRASEPDPQLQSAPTGGDSSDASIAVLGSGEVRVAFQSERQDLVMLQPAAPTKSNVYLFRSLPSPRVTLLSRIKSLTRDEVAKARDGLDGNPGAADSFRPRLSADGRQVVFETLADNLDAATDRDDDLNRAPDIVVADLSRLATNDFVVPTRLSVSVKGSDANGPSTRPVFGSFVGASSMSRFRGGFAAYLTEALNTGAGIYGRKTDAARDPEVVIAYIAPTAAAEFDAMPMTDGAALQDGQVKGGDPLVVQFRDLSSGDPEALRWDFGDPATGKRNVSTAKMPTHTYTEVGTYDVTLRIQTQGGILTETKRQIVRVFPEPVASFTVPRGLEYITEDGSAAVRLLDQSSGEPFAWKWDVDSDGATDSTVQNPTAQYARPGRYTVSLTAIGFGGEDTTPPERRRTISVFQRVQAEFSANLTRVPDTNPVVRFTDRSIGDIQTWLWNFGDPRSGGNNTSTEPNPTHRFSGAGRYDVTLSVTGPGTDNADQELKDDYITVAGRLEAFFTPDDVVEIGDSVAVSFMGMSRGSVTPSEWRWDFDGDGETDSMDQNPVNVRFDRGTDLTRIHDVTLTAIGPNDEVSNPRGEGTVTLHKQIDAMFDASETSGSTPLTVVFMDTTTNPASVSRTWNFDDPDNSTPDNPNTSTAPMPSHVYKQPGVYTVRLDVIGPGDDPDVDPPIVNRDSALLPITITPGFDLVYRIFSDAGGTDHGCVSCHRGVSAGGGLNLDDIDTGFADLVGMPPGMPPDRPDCPGETHVISMQPAESYLIRKLRSRPPVLTCGSKMPSSALRDPFSFAELTAVKSWIDDGATSGGFTAVYDIIEDANGTNHGCVGCHSGMSPGGGLSLDDQATAFAELVTNPDMPPNCSGEARVRSRDARDSLLFKKLCGSTEMPPTGSGTPLTPTEVALVEEWIRTGAPR